MTQPANAYGSCLATIPQNGFVDLTPDMQVATGRDVLAQALVRRLTTPRGSVITSPNDCIDVRNLLSKGLTTAQLQSLSRTIRTEVIRDQRVFACSVAITFNPTTGATSIVISVQSGYGPFTLTLSLTASGAIGIILAGQ